MMTNPLPMTPPEENAAAPSARPPVFIVVLVGILFLQLGVILFYWMKPMFDHTIATQPLAPVATGAASPTHSSTEVTTHNNVMVVGPVSFAGEGKPAIYQVYGTPPYQTKRFAYADGRVDYILPKMGIQRTEDSIGVDDQGVMTFFIPGAASWKFPTPIELTIQRTGFKPVTYHLMVQQNGQDGLVEIPPTVLQRR